MTVAELIALLQQEDPNAEVWHEGCDCWGKASAVSKQEDHVGGHIVLIERE